MQLQSSPYSIVPVAYYERYKRNIETHNATQDKSYLFYASLELRYTIESVFFCYLWILSDCKLSEKQKKIWRAKDLKKEILEIDPHFPFRLDFIPLVSYMSNEFAQTAKPDFELLTDSWSHLGYYLHARKVVVTHNLPEEYWIEFKKVLAGPAHNLSLVLSHPFVNLQFTTEGDTVIERYASGQITSEQVVNEFQPRWGRIFESVTEYIHEV